MKRFISLSLSLVLLLLPFCTFISCDTVIGGDVKTLYVYNWGEYISDGSEGCLDSNRAFELWYEYKYGEKINVVYSTYSSNEDMYAKLSGGAVSYDVIVPSDYMIERLRQENMLAPLSRDEQGNLINIPHASNLSENFFGEDAGYDEYDPGSVYSIPYFYGMIGIIYNTTMVDKEDIGSWDLMWNEKYKGNILQFNNSRDAFGSAQYKLGIDVNTDDEDEWKRALKELKAQKGIVQGYVMDEIFNKMEGGSAAIAAYYAGDFLTMYENTTLEDKPSDLDFFYPEEGTNLYVDAMCIPKTSRNQLEAERYIDFMLMVDEDFDEGFFEFYNQRTGEEFYSAAIANAEYTYYASPNRKVVDDEGYRGTLEDIKEGAFDLMYDEDALKTATSYKNLTPKKLILINTLWEELKSDIDVSPVIITICVVIVVSLAGGGLFFALRKRFRNNY